jgi:hypothetical protein
MSMNRPIWLGSVGLDVRVKLVGSSPRHINLGLSLLGREASLLRRQLLPPGAGGKFICLGGTPIGLDLGDISQVSMLACLAPQLVTMLRPTTAHYVDHCNQNDDNGNDDCSDDGERH